MWLKSQDMVSKMLMDAFYLLSINCGQHPIAGVTFYVGLPTVLCYNGYTQIGTAT